ncbi:hypothetical protein IQ272_06940 [Chroococcidiopsidales cyanobacterium LEGE 13417]|nr:hypothetical protein [Chroococcidiopsidales cyanobacterium LEGE 13417]
MINATLTVKIRSVDETHDPQGVKIVYGDCSFHSYSKDGLVESTTSFRAKGAAAVAIARVEAGTDGVAVGYPDMEVVDTGNGYKEKKCTLFIRNFIPTEFGQSKLAEKHLQSQLAEHTLITAATASNSVSVNELDIPF